jgi:hypothetical protein
MIQRYAGNIRHQSLTEFRIQRNIPTELLKDKALIPVVYIAIHVSLRLPGCINQCSRVSATHMLRLCQPVAARQKIRVQLGFRRTLLWLPIVAPNRSGRHGGKHRFNAATGLQTVLGASVNG